MHIRKRVLFIFSIFFAVLLVPASAQLFAATPEAIIDDFNDGDASDWGFFGGNNAGGGGGALTDRPQEGAAYLSTGWGGQGTASGFYGGAFKNFDNANQVILPADPWFNVWVFNQSDATVDQYTLEITIREDLDGNGWSDGVEESFRLDTVYTSASFDDQWTLLSAPVSDFPLAAGSGNGVFDGNLDEIVIVVAGVQGADPSVVEVDFDQFSFTSGGPLGGVADIVDDFENGLPSGFDSDGVGIGFQTFSDGSPIGIATTDTPPVQVPGADAGNNVMAVTATTGAFAGFSHAFENTAVDTWVPQDWSSYEGFALWVYGQNSNTGLFIDLIDNRPAGSTSDNAERYTVAFVDDFSGWQYLEFPFADFVRKDIGNGAPNDGLTLTQVHGWAFGMLGTGGVEITYYLDDATLYGVAEIPPLAVTFDNARYPIDEGATGNVLVKLNRPMNADDPAQVSVDYTTEAGTATPGKDYTPTSGTLTFVNGGPSQLSFPITTFEDSKFEGGESIILRLSNPVDAEPGFFMQAGAFIEDNDEFDPNLIDDFQYGPYKIETNGLVGVDTIEIESSSAEAIPGQDAFETVLEIGSPFAVAPLTALEEAQAAIDALVPTGDRQADNQLRRASFLLGRTTDANYWDSDYQLDTRSANKVFNGLSQTVRELDRAAKRAGAPSAAIRAIIADLVEVADGLAQYAIDQAVASNGRSSLITQANNQMALADNALSRDQFPRAMAHFRNAWTKANNAVKGMDLAAPSLVHDFALGQDWTNGEALTFWYYGSNSGEAITVDLKENRAPDPGPSGWNMVWSEEFNEPAGTPPNPDYWTYEIGDGTVNGIPGWGNDEFQYYTDDPANAATDGNGNMVLTVLEGDGSLECYYGPCEYTSARLISWRKAEFAYGRIETRLLVPDGGSGIWPAFWSLGTDIDVVQWPQTGEIDFMEYVSRLPNEIFGTIHGPGYAGGQSFGNVYDFGQPVYNDYHTFVTEWEPDLIKWYVDGILYHTATPADVPGEWVFNDPVFLLLNIAMGGNFGGAIDPNIEFPQSMKVDYIRVYQGPDTAERFEATFVDDFTGWQLVEVPFTDFVRSAEQPAGAPNDGLTFEEVWGYGLTLPAGSSALLDQVRVKQLPPPTELVVTTLANGGDGSLRDVLTRIAPGGTVTFDPSLAGGTIALGGPVVPSDDVVIDATATPGISLNGGGVDRVLIVEPGLNVTVKGLTLTNGYGFQLGGAIINNGSLTLENSAVTGNTMTTDAGDFWQGGGGIYSGDGASLTLIDSTVADNFSGWTGGGIYSFFNTTTTIIRSTVSGNVATDVGGGMRTLGNVTIDNSTISGNTSTAWHGGAAFITDGVADVSNSTITGNNAPGGTTGGFFVGTFGDSSATMNIQNSIVAANGDFGCFLAPFGAGAVAINSLGNNVFTDAAFCAGGADQVVGDALLDGLADNGGPTLTHALLAGSPAIGAANNAACPATDQRGVVRDAACDVGAFELVP